MPVKKKENGLTVPKKEPNKKEWHCTFCNHNFVKDSFYLSYSIINRGNDGRMSICKKCVEDLFNILVDKHKDCKIALYRMCQMLDIYYDTVLYGAVEKQATESKSNICKIYVQKINSLPQYRNKVFADSTSFEFDLISMGDANYTNLDYSDDDKQNKNDVIKLLGFDPFFSENDKDKKFLYNTLNGYLDEDTLQDGFKISAIIEIVKSFNQLESINKSIAQMTADEDINTLSHTQLKAFIGAKADLTRQINSFAKENGISTMHSNSKSKGANTLSGILKELRDKNIRESDVNLFDIRTCEAFRQLADISNKSITAQLQFDDNDYADMINQQRAKIATLQAELDKTKEEKRKLSIELKTKNDNEEM